jgi:class 3 adenylate cyclase/tetratricopeptide (TPR) repeat protein
MERSGPERRVERRLAAILAADVAGYSRLMGLDEEGTLRALKGHRTALVDRTIAAHYGRIVKTMGDGLLVEFASAVNAVHCAVELQRGMLERNAEVPADRRIEFRVGVNVGDIIVDGEDILGDGVNVAARLETLADVGGICVSSRVQEDLIGRIDVQFVDLGEQQLKNLVRPVRVYRIVSGTASKPAHRKSASEKVHSILVLPFSSVGGDQEQQDLAEAITDDLTHDLSRIPGTMVIAQGTAATLKGQLVDSRAAAKEFGVRYVIDGSARIGTDRIRINVQLVDAETGGQVWSDRIDAPRLELAELQDTVSGRIAWALELELPGVESRRSQTGGSQSPDAFELSMQGWSLMNRAPSLENVLAAQEQFQRAQNLDPHSLSARIGLSFVHVRKVVSYWTNAPEEDLARSKELIEPALLAAPRHDRGHFVKGLILRTERQPEQSSVFFERAIRINPNYAQAIAFLGFNHTLVGRPEQTFHFIEHAIRLSPRDPQLGVWLGFVCEAHLQLQRFDQAAEVAARAVAANPEYGLAHLRLAIAHALAGRREEAKVAHADAMRLLPNASADFLLTRRALSMHPAYVASEKRVCAALQAIGLPE